MATSPQTKSWMAVLFLCLIRLISVSVASQRGKMDGQQRPSPPQTWGKHQDSMALTTIKLNVSWFQVSQHDLIKLLSCVKYCTQVSCLSDCFSTFWKIPSHFILSHHSQKQKGIKNNLGDWHEFYKHVNTLVGLKSTFQKSEVTLTHPDNVTEICSSATMRTNWTKMFCTRAAQNPHQGSQVARLTS